MRCILEITCEDRKTGDFIWHLIESSKVYNKVNRMEIENVGRNKPTCEHVWFEDYSIMNGKMKSKCAKCGMIKE